MCAECAHITSIQYSRTNVKLLKNVLICVINATEKKCKMVAPTYLNICIDSQSRSLKVPLPVVLVFIFTMWWVVATSSSTGTNTNRLKPRLPTLKCSPFFSFSFFKYKNKNLKKIKGGLVFLSNFELWTEWNL